MDATDDFPRQQPHLIYLIQTPTAPAEGKHPFNGVV